MRKQKLTDKQMLEIIVGKIVIKVMQYAVVGAMITGFVLVALNNMTVYR